MSSAQTSILRLLAQQRRKPGELASLLGISRQALHRHLRALINAKKIQKEGAGPHVSYLIPRGHTPHTRVRQDYEWCREYLLPNYLDVYGDRMVEAWRRQSSPEGEHTIPLGFLLDAAAVYSSNIEGNTLDLSSFLNSRMSEKKHRPKEAREIEDLVSAYAYAKQKMLRETHVLRAHGMLSRTFVAPTRQGVYRQEPVGVFSARGLEYMAVEPQCVSREMRELFVTSEALLRSSLEPAECFFWGAWLHLMIALIHPFSDGNGRTARLCEKWFLSLTLGRLAYAFPSEQLYWNHRPQYYAALTLGVNYWEVDMSKAFAFFGLLPEALLCAEGSSP